MRVISGENKGHRLVSPKGKNTRPTEDRVKESIFNILMPIKSESVVFDIFSGSGQIGIEFLSRGASKAVFVDYAKESISVINENLEKTKLKEKATVIKNGYLNALMYYNESDVLFDYIYMDPPFNETKLFTDSLEKISAYNILKDDGIIIVEHDKDLVLSDTDNLRIIDNRKYGNVAISILTKHKR